MDFWEAVFIICKIVHRKQWSLGTELPVNESFVFLLSIHISKLLVAFYTHFTHFLCNGLNCLNCCLKYCCTEIFIPFWIKIDFQFKLLFVFFLIATLV